MIGAVMIMAQAGAEDVLEQPGPEAALLLEHVLLEADAPVLEIRVQLFAAALELLLDLVLGRRMRSTSSLILRFMAGPVGGAERAPR